MSSRFNCLFFYNLIINDTFLFKIIHQSAKSEIFYDICTNTDYQVKDRINVSDYYTVLNNIENLISSTTIKALIIQNSRNQNIILNIKKHVLKSLTS